MERLEREKESEKKIKHLRLILDCEGWQRNENESADDEMLLFLSRSLKSKTTSEPSISFAVTCTSLLNKKFSLSTSTIPSIVSFST